MPTSPRRSSRAVRGPTQPPSQQSHSNSSSLSSSQRVDRNTRSNNKQDSPQKSSTPHSLSSEPLTEHTAVEPPPTRRSKRRQEHEQEDDHRVEGEMDDEGGDGEGAIRCICGYSDYPGPAADGQPEAQIDFVMCDSCNQWQHGGCVGIFDESTNPEEYFCEECRPGLHQVAKAKDGRRYSRYLPIYEKIPSKSSHRKPPTVKTADTKSTKEKDKASRLVPDASTKRRSTMNSRAAYDEEEVLRKVLEESKSEGQQGQDTASRKSKRSRDESEDAQPDAKRQRTNSDTSPSSPSEEPTPNAEADDQGKGSKRTAARGAAAKTQREKELREREKERAVAASKRQGRADRRRADESDPQEDLAKPGERKALQDEPPGSQPPDTPASSAAMSMAPRRGGRQVGGKRGGRGRNTNRDQDATAGTESGSPIRKNGKTSASPREANGNDGVGSGADSTAGAGNGGPPAKKGKQQHQRDPSMAELKKKAAAMVDYISQSQIEMAKWNERGLGQILVRLHSDATANPGVSDEITKQMGELSTKLVKWQEEYGKWPDK